MTQEENNLESRYPDMDPFWRDKLKTILACMPKETLQDVQQFAKEVGSKEKAPEQSLMCFLPHQMAKTSIFFPMSREQLKEENRKISKIEQETAWGKIVIEGVKLSIFEEDLFLVLLKLAQYKTPLKEDKYILKTNMNHITNLLYGRAGYNKKAYERIEQGLRHFQLVRFEITTGEWKKKGKERLQARHVRSIGNIVQAYDYDEKTQDLTIEFNDRFFAYFIDSMLTDINYTIRRHLKKDGSKALYRFLKTHTNPGRMHMLTVLNAINYNLSQPTADLRKRIKEILQELKKNKIIGPKSCLQKDDIIYFDQPEDAIKKH